MPPGLNVVPTRQEADELASTQKPLGIAGTFVSDVFEVAGYDTAEILGIGDQAFSLQVEEACALDGPFVVTQTGASGASLGKQVLCARNMPCGSFMKVTFSNTSGTPQTSFSACILGIPVP